MNGLTLINRRTGRTIAAEVEVAVTRKARRQGLLGRDALDVSAAIVIAPCFSIHTAFMRFAIDVVFVAGDGRVLRIVQDLPPWRMTWSPAARAVVELAAGVLRTRELLIGDMLYLAPLGPGCGDGPALSFASSSLRMAARPA